MVEFIAVPNHGCGGGPCRGAALGPGVSRGSCQWVSTASAVAAVNGVLVEALGVAGVQAVLFPSAVAPLACLVLDLRAGNSYLKPIFHFICSICSKNRFLIEFAPPESFLLDQKTYLFDQKTYFEMPQPLDGEDEVLIALPSTVGVTGCGMQHAAPTLRYLRGPHAVGRFLVGRPSRAQWLLSPCRAP